MGQTDIAREQRLLLREKRLARQQKHKALCLARDAAEARGDSAEAERLKQAAIEALLVEDRERTTSKGESGNAKAPTTGLNVESMTLEVAEAARRAAIQEKEELDAKIRGNHQPMTVAELAVRNDPVVQKRWRRRRDQLLSQLRDLKARIKSLRRGHTLDQYWRLKRIARAAARLRREVGDAAGNLRELDEALHEMDTAHSGWEGVL